MTDSNPADIGTSPQTTIQLSVNLNKIALIRNSRDGDYPNVTEFGRLSIAAGAKGLTVHPRPDLRHIRPDDVFALAKLTKDEAVEFNIEGNPFANANSHYPGLLALVESTRPDQCTLVPDSNDQKTSDHGFNLHKDFDRLTPIIQQLKQWGVRVSLFMDPIPEQIQLAHEVGADRIELYTGPFAWAYEKSNEAGQVEFDKHVAAAKLASSLGLGINAGHDLNLENMTLYKTLPNLQEVSIGHALTVDALLKGYSKTVQDYLQVCS